MVLYPFLLVRELPVDPILMKHELVHFEQIKRLGVVKFYFDYVCYYLLNRMLGMGHDEAYFNNPFEVEAYRRERDL